MFYIELHAFKSSFLRRFFKKKRQSLRVTQGDNKKMTMTNISTIAG